MNPGLIQFVRRSALFFLSLTLSVIIIVKLWPESEVLIFAEDGIVEYGTAIVDGLAATLGFHALYLGVLREKPLVERLVLLTIPILSLFCALDEISWGARLFDLHMPEMQGGGEFDGVHDVFVLLERWAVAADAMTLSFAIVGLVLGLSLIAYWQRAFVAECLACAVNHPLARPLVCAIALLALATLLDFAHGRIVSSLEEYSELSAALFMLVAAYGGLHMGLAGRSRAAVARLKDA